MTSKVSADLHGLATAAHVPYVAPSSDRNQFLEEVIAAVEGRPRRLVRNIRMVTPSRAPDSPIIHVTAPGEACSDH